MMSELRLEQAPQVGTPARFASADSVAQAVRVQIIKSHIGTHKTKTRSEVHGTGKKIYKQKGTGSARHGDRCAPQFRSGGVAHGPVVSHRRVKVNKKAARVVRQTLVANAANNGLLYVLHGVDPEMTPSTKTVVQLLKEDAFRAGAILVTDNEGLRRSARNLPGLHLCNGGVVDSAALVRGRPLIVDAAVYETFRERCLPPVFEQQEVA